MTTWWPARRRLAALVVLMAALTGAAGAALGTSDWHVHGAGVYVVIAVVALFFSGGITVQVIGGQVLAGSLLSGLDGTSALLLLPMVAGVVFTAELLGVVARLDTPLERDPTGDLQGAALATVIGGGVFGAVVLIGDLPGPTGLTAIALASGACGLLAILLAKKAP